MAKTGRDSVDDPLFDIESGEVETGKLDIGKDRFPHCVVWTPLPVLSWFIPFIGHVGIANTKGIIYDFGGPYYIGVDNMAFGRPTKYWQLDLSKVEGGARNYNAGVLASCDEFEKTMHNICINNCHHHVITAMNQMQYDGKKNWNQVHLALLLLIHGKYTGASGFIKTYFPFLTVVSIAALLSLLT